MDDGLRLLRVSNDGRTLTLAILDDPCHPVKYDGMAETADEVTIKVTMRVVQRAPGTSCLTVATESRHTVSLSEPLGQRRITRDVDIIDKADS